MVPHKQPITSSKFKPSRLHGSSNHKSSILWASSGMAVNCVPSVLPLEAVPFLCAGEENDHFHANPHSWKIRYFLPPQRTNKMMRFFAWPSQVPRYLRDWVTCPWLRLLAAVAECLQVKGARAIIGWSPIFLLSTLLIWKAGGGNVKCTSFTSGSTIDADAH